MSVLGPRQEAVWVSSQSCFESRLHHATSRQISVERCGGDADGGDEEVGALEHSENIT